LNKGLGSLQRRNLRGNWDAVRYNHAIRHKYQEEQLEAFVDVRFLERRFAPSPTTTPWHRGTSIGGMCKNIADKAQHGFALRSNNAKPGGSETKLESRGHYGFVWCPIDEAK